MGLALVEAGVCSLAGDCSHASAVDCPALLVANSLSMTNLYPWLMIILYYFIIKYICQGTGIRLYITRRLIEKGV
jgi:hypothetical protein